RGGAPARRRAEDRDSRRGWRQESRGHFRESLRSPVPPIGRGGGSQKIPMIGVFGKRHHYPWRFDTTSSVLNHEDAPMPSIVCAGILWFPMETNGKYRENHQLKRPNSGTS